MTHTQAKPTNQPAHTVMALGLGLGQELDLFWPGLWLRFETIAGARAGSETQVGLVWDFGWE